MMEYKIKCPVCNEVECYKESENNVDSYLCISCGYTTNSLYLQNSIATDKWEENTPMLIKNSKFIDSDTGLIWYPSVLNFPSIGIIFPDGNSEFDWQWRVARFKEIPENERSEYPIPNKPGEFYSSKIDMESSICFDRDDFKDACVELGILIAE